MNKTKTNYWSKWIIVYGTTALILTIAISIFQIVIDPFGVWNTKSIDHLNHFKSGQMQREAVFKPYQYADEKPDIVILGNSRADYGMPPVWTPNPNQNVYNLSFQSMWMAELHTLVQFAMRTHRPKTIVLMLNPLLLLNVPGYNRGNRRDTLFGKRLEAISTGLLSRQLSRLKDTVFSIDSILLSVETIIKSGAAKETEPFHLKGWVQRMGVATHSNHPKYLNDMWHYHHGANRTLRAYPETMVLLAKILREIEKTGIRLFVVFEPESADFLLSFESHKRTPYLNAMKLQLSEITDFWDFGYVNSITTQRDSYIDASHYRGIVGEHIIDRINGRNKNVPDDFGVFVTSQNIDDHLQYCQGQLYNWKKKQSDLLNLLRRLNQPAQEAEFIQRLQELVLSVEKKQKP